MSFVATTALTELWAKCKAAFAPLTHGHSASDITSGILPTSRGGTGRSDFSEYNIVEIGLAGHWEDVPTAFWGDEDGVVTATGALPVNYGGTGAANAAAARTNLGAQETLVSGTNIKTINNQSLLGSGNIAISGGVTVDSALSATSANPVENRAIHSALAEKLAAADFGDALDEEIVGRGTGYGLLYLAENDRVLTLDDALAYIGAADADHTHDAGDITSGTLAAARIPQLAQTKVTPIYYEAHGSGDKSLSAGTITQVTLVTTGALSSGSGLAIASGGIKITNAGRYRVTGSAYINAGGTNHGAYVYKAASSGAFSAATEQFSGLTTNAAAGGVIAGTKILQCAANDIIYLAARSTGAANTCDQDNGATYLLVERLS